ncbi:MAG TPA: lipoyl domain-containing protein [Candidatus Binatia bacterium]|jgi:2-oxoglutarate dehydrogenase E2 component (dihydrolipoamide succinyltransferase)
MKKDVTIPRLGSSDESDEVRILRWIKTKGARVQKGEALLEVETDKVNVEIESPGDGQLAEIKAQEGEFVKFGAVVAVIDTSN